MVYKINFETQVTVTAEEIELIRKQNRNFLSQGFFAVDNNIGQAIAYNKALEQVVKQNPEIITTINLTIPSKLTT